MTGRRAGGRPLADILIALIAAGLAAVAGVSPAHAQEGAHGGAPIAVHFDWPVGMEARVDARRFQVQSQNGQSDTTGTAVAYTLSVEADEEGRLIRVSDLAIGPGGELPAHPPDLLQRLSTIMPSYVVSEQGELIRLANLAVMREEIRAFVLPLRDSVPPGAASGFEALLDQMTSEEVLFAQAAQEWNALVGVWVDAELEPGMTYEFQGEEEVPLLPGELVTFDYELGLMGRVPCAEADSSETPIEPSGAGYPEPASGGGCVALHLVSRPDPGAIKQIMSGFIDQYLAELGTLAFEDLSIVNEIHLRARPESLQPHGLEIYQQIDMTLTVDGESQAMSQRRVRLYRFDYPR